MTDQTEKVPSDEDVARVWTLIEDIGLCMFASHDADVIRARPMQAIARKDENAIFFLTDAGGHKDEEIAADETVCLCFAKPGEGKFLAVAGHARVLNDRGLIQDLWSVAANAWWKGPEDPNVRAIEVTPKDAQFWEGPHGVVAIIAMVAAAATAGMPVLGDQRKVDLN
jgi:general stress protein 26